jgi:hypothetical protein
MGTKLNIFRRGLSITGWGKLNTKNVQKQYKQ